MSKRRVGMLIAGLVALPLISTADSQTQRSETDEKLHWLLAAHNVRHGMQVPKQTEECLASEAEHSR